MQKLFILTISLLFLLSASHAEVIITNPKEGLIVTNNTLIIKGATDETGEIKIKLIKENTEAVIFSTALEPDENGKWETEIGTTELEGGSYYITAETTRNKKSVKIFLKTDIKAEISLNKRDYEKAELVRISAKLKEGGEAYEEGTLDVKIKPPSNTHEIVFTLEKKDEEYLGFFYIATTATMGKWEVYTNTTTEKYTMQSNREEFFVEPTRFSFFIVNEKVKLGETIIFLAAQYKNEESVKLPRIETTTISPTNKTKKLNFTKLQDGLYHARIDFDEEGTWKLDIEAQEYKNLGKEILKINVSGQKEIDIKMEIEGGRVKGKVTREGKGVESDVKIYLDGEAYTITKTNKNGEFEVELGKTFESILVVAESEQNITPSVITKNDSVIVSEEEVEGTIIKNINFVNKAVSLDLVGLVVAKKGETKEINCKIRNEGDEKATLTFSKENLPDWVSVPEKITIEAKTEKVFKLGINVPDDADEVYSGSLFVGNEEISTKQNIVLFIKENENIITGMAASKEGKAKMPLNRVIAGLVSIIGTYVFFFHKERIDLATKNRRREISIPIRGNR